MDMNMPVMDGMKATNKLREMHSEGKIKLDKTKILLHSAI